MNSTNGISTHVVRSPLPGMDSRVGALAQQAAPVMAVPKGSMRMIYPPDAPFMSVIKTKLQPYFDNGQLTELVLPGARPCLVTPYPEVAELVLATSKVLSMTTSTKVAMIRTAYISQDGTRMENSSDKAARSQYRRSQSRGRNGRGQGNGGGNRPARGGYRNGRSRSRERSPSADRTQSSPRARSDSVSSTGSASSVGSNSSGRSRVRPTLYRDLTANDARYVLQVPVSASRMRSLVAPIYESLAGIHFGNMSDGVSATPYVVIAGNRAAVNAITTTLGGWCHNLQQDPYIHWVEKTAEQMQNWSQVTVTYTGAYDTTKHMNIRNPNA